MTNKSKTYTNMLPEGAEDFGELQARSVKSFSLKVGDSITRRAGADDLVVGNTIYVCGDDNYLHKKVITKVLNPFDRFKAFLADDGCRYGMENCYVNEEK